LISSFDAYRFPQGGIIVTKANIALLRALGAGQVSAQTGSVDDSAKAEGGAFAVEPLHTACTERRSQNMADTSDTALAASLPGDFRNGYAEVNGTRIHYVEGGKGTPVFLLPGWPQTWWQFHKIMPELAKRHRVIAVDLRGMGGSDKPGLGYDKKNMAQGYS
jgi:alpha/beta hydrolase fold